MKRRKSKVERQKTKKKHTEMRFFFIFICIFQIFVVILRSISIFNPIKNQK